MDPRTLGWQAGPRQRVSVRSVRRLPAEAQANRTLMGSAAGVSWALRQGRVLREPPPMVAQPVVLPAPTVESAAAEEPDEYRELEGPAQLPTMAHEGETRRMDQEAQDVEAAAILEDLVPLEDSEVFPQAGGIGDLASELGAPAEENPSTVCEGAGSAASSAAAPPRPPFPTGLGEGGLGQGGAKREGAGNLEEARPPKQPKGTAKKAQRIERLSSEAEELWARIESWACADDPAQTQQRLASVMELLDSASDPAQIQQARLDQLRKLWRLKAFTPVHKKDKPTAAQTFHYKWVDKVKEGVAKSRFTCADVKRAYTAEQEQDLRVFVPDADAGSPRVARDHGPAERLRDAHLRHSGCVPHRARPWGPGGEVGLHEATSGMATHLGRMGAGTTAGGSDASLGTVQRDAVPP